MRRLLSVYSEFDYADLDLRVDWHDAAVDELRRMYEDYKPYQAYYRERFGDRTKPTMVQEDFALMLEEKKKAAAKAPAGVTCSCTAVSRSTCSPVRWGAVMTG